MRHLLRIAALAILLAALPDDAARSAAGTDAFDAALAHYEAGDYAGALAAFRALAQQGHAGAEAMLGMMFFEGEGVAADPVIAAAWFMKSALKGHASAQLALGALYQEGKGVARDPEEAFRWLSLAERAGGSIAEEARRRKAGLLRELDPATRQRISDALRDWRPNVARPQ